MIIGGVGVIQGEELEAPLDGIKVIECGTWILAPRAAGILQVLGADVIKIEEKVSGDTARGYRMTLSEGMISPQRNWMFEYPNRGKRSIALDLRKEKGKEVAHRLIEKADVFVQYYTWLAKS